MSYTGSNAFSGEGSILAINTGTVATPVYTPIAEVCSADLSGRQAATQSVTSFSSLNKTAEFIATLITPGDLKLVINYNPGDAGQTALQASFNGLTKVMYKLTLSLSPLQTTTPDSYTFSAICTDYSFSVSPEKAIQVQSSLKISGPLTYSAGS